MISKSVAKRRKMHRKKISGILKVHILGSNLELEVSRPREFVPKKFVLLFMERCTIGA